jgi:hypothetical protein
MAYYNLRRVADQKSFIASRTDDQRALFYFSILVGEELTFDGSGASPYLLGRRTFAVGPLKTNRPVYRKVAA